MSVGGRELLEKNVKIMDVALTTAVAAFIIAIVRLVSLLFYVMIINHHNLTCFTAYCILNKITRFIGNWTTTAQDIVILNFTP